MSTARPAMTVVVISDYGGGPADDWTYLRATLRAIAEQDFDEPVEVVLVDASPAGQPMPADLPALVPALRILTGDASICELLNQAARAAASDWIGLVDGDCVPEPGWIRAAVEVSRVRPDAVAVSGRTRYPDRCVTYRIVEGRGTAAVGA